MTRTLLASAATMLLAAGAAYAQPAYAPNQGSPAATQYEGSANATTPTQSSFAAPMSYGYYEPQTSTGLDVERSGKAISLYDARDPEG